MAMTTKQKRITKMKGDLSFFMTLGFHIRAVTAAIPMATALESYLSSFEGQKLIVAGSVYLMLAVVHSLVNRRIAMLRTEIEYLDNKLESGP